MALSFAWSAMLNNGWAGRVKGMRLTVDMCLTTSVYGMYTHKLYYDPERPKQYSVCQGFWFHVDGALGGSYMPFIRMAHMWLCTCT